MEQEVKDKINYISEEMVLRNYEHRMSKLAPILLGLAARIGYEDTIDLVCYIMIQWQMQIDDPEMKVSDRTKQEWDSALSLATACAQRAQGLAREWRSKNPDHDGLIVTVPQSTLREGLDTPPSTVIH